MKEYISTNKNFQYSVNLKYDLNNYQKVNNYIFTDYSITILNELVNNINNGKNNSNLLIGPYGKGKSHLMLLLIALVSRNDFKGLEILINNIQQEYPELSEKIVKLKNKKMFPIIVNSGYKDIKNSILYSIKESLEKSNLINLMPDTYFENAKKVIKKWVKNEEAKNKMETIIKTKYESIDEYMSFLDMHDINAYDFFKKMYKQMTLGVDFEPLVDSNLEILIEDLNKNLKERYDFDGIYLIFDEFSKFIEGSINKDVAFDLRLLQGLAEKFSNSKDLFLTCITHKPISEYVYQLPKEKVDSWRAIEGRFKEYYFTSSAKSSYKLIKNAIIKTGKWEKIYKKNLDESEVIIRRSFDEGLFENNAIFDDIKKGCFPLNPISTFSLIRVSEKVAQNERTLFTFLSKEGSNTLNDFLKREKNNLLNIDVIYDYFEKSFEKETFNKKIYDIWLKSNSAIKESNDKLSKKIIKALAIIKIVGEKNLKPTDKMIALALNLYDDSESVTNKIEELENDMILLKKSSNNQVVFLPGSNINIKERIKKIKNLKIKNYNYSNELLNTIKPGYITPKAYNYKNKITRFFKNIFIEADIIDDLDYNELLSAHNSDGLVINIINTNNISKDLIINKIKEINKNEQVIFKITNNNFYLAEELENVLAIQKIKKDKKLLKENIYLKNELEIFLKDIIEKMVNEFEKAFLNYNNCEVVYLNNVISVNSKKGFNRKISDIFEKLYYCTPIINNELINKDNISSIIERSRNEIVEYILNNFEGNFDFKGKSATSTLYRTLIFKKGLEKELETNDDKLREILELIKNYVLETEGEKTSFEELYQQLRRPPYGMRKGVIPVYLSLVLEKYHNEIVIYLSDREVTLDVSLINKINKTPEMYSLYLEKGTKEKEEYLKNIKDVFKDEFSPKREESYNKYHYIVNLMQSFIRRLPQYSRSFEYYYVNNSKTKLKKEYVKLRSKLLRFDINNHELLFEVLPKNLYSDLNYNQICNELKTFKNIHEKHIKKLKEFLIKKTINLLLSNYNGSISSALNRWVEIYDYDQIIQAGDSRLRKLYNFSDELQNNNEYMIIDRIANIITGFSIEDWNDENIDKYLNNFEEIVNKLKETKTDDKTFKLNKFEIKFNEDNRILIPNTELSGISENLLQELRSIIEEYSYSLDELEKQNVLIKILKENIE